MITMHSQDTLDIAIEPRYLSVIGYGLDGTLSAGTEIFLFSAISGVIQQCSQCVYADQQIG
jgi:hypothetical protein